MAISRVRYTCGCGFGTTSTDKAMEHCNARGHKLTVSGYVTPEPESSLPKQHSKRLDRSPEPTASYKGNAQSTELPDTDTDLDYLRKKMER